MASGRDVIIACDFDSRQVFDDFLALFDAARPVVGDDDTRASGEPGKPGESATSGQPEKSGASETLDMPEKPFLKIGMELFFTSGPDIVRSVKERGYRVFLDLKLHDIPTTVEKTMRVLGRLGADICNVHIAGGSQMMRQAAMALREAAGDGASEGSAAPLLIGVTQLTSIDQKRLENELLIERPIADVVTQYALLAKDSGLDGVVCSAQEIGTVHAACGDDFVTVTPGIRPAGAAVNDQQRVTTPSQAKAMGGNLIVVGRPITQSKDPVAAYRQIWRDFAAA
ncbi:MAG: orotidine-5'-phosphate decarboxylase [Actinomycetaceae bacterium]|nr:orotidine-5'-phosphate decarboxylase [Actinomycetaceae bacterium]MDY6083593.1 orotidine-5'-phosphate decarboxylase [Actinomycetaceae bacterium]